MLRTRAMREKEEQREMRKYNYTLLRVRFPDGYILQGKGLLALFSPSPRASITSNGIKQQERGGVTLL